MPFQLYVQPRGGELIGRGIEKAADALSNAMTMRADIKKQAKADADLVSGFKSMVEKDPDLQSRLGITADTDWNDFSVNEIKGLYEGFKLKALGQQDAINEQNLINARDAGARGQRADYYDYLQRQGEQQFLGDLSQARSNPNQPLSPVFQERYADILANPGAQLATNYYESTGQAPSAAFMERYGPMVEEQWKPGMVDAGGVPMLMTSRNSAVPVPAGYQGQRPNPGGPIMSEDGKFYQTTDGNWKPMPREGAGSQSLNPIMTQQYTTRQIQIQRELAEIDKALPDASTWRMMPGESKQSLEDRKTKLMDELAGIDAVMRGGQPNLQQPSQPASTTNQFATEEEAQKALSAGLIQPGQTIYINGKAAKVN